MFNTCCRRSSSHSWVHQKDGTTVQSLYVLTARRWPVQNRCHTLWLKPVAGHNAFLLGILDWLSTINSKGNDGSILILLDGVSVVIYSWLLHVPGRSKRNWIFWIFAWFFPNILYMLWLSPQFYSWAVNVMLVFHIYFRPLTVHKILFMAIILLKHDVWLWHNNSVCLIHDRYSE